MTVGLMTLLIWLGSLVAGLLGSLTGLGGGVIVVPLLTLGFGIDLKYAVGASLVSVIATSSGAAAAYVKEGYTNVRIGMLLEVGTTIGALSGALIASYVARSTIGIVFGAVLILSAYLAMQPKHEGGADGPADKLAEKLRLNGTYPTENGLKSYRVTGIPGGFILMFGAGLLSAMLGIGSGSIKVLAMDQIMKIPFKVSTTTSNFMIGVTGAASVGYYLSQGYIDPVLAAPVMLGVLGGSLLGARILGGAKVKVLRSIFAIVISVVGLEMIYKGFQGGFDK
jgi:uncharacterized membrane protein YfcA